ncbi:MAG: hypothetical protein GWP91_23640 [Rhodobacterales bacterium]|nr:hypothetical protein [Rhodobacterales bacterium]
MARLFERLEGSCPTRTGQPDKMMAELERTTREQVEEFVEVSVAEEPAAHAAFLRREHVETFVPRYPVLALLMGEKESGGYGFGAACEPVVRRCRFAISLFVLWFVFLKMIYLPIVWPLVLLVLSFATWPSIAAWLVQRRSRSQLLTVVTDLSRTQEQHSTYLPKSAFSNAEESRRSERRKRRAERSMDSKIAQNEKRADAEGLVERARALAGCGGRNWVKLKVAEALQGKKSIRLPLWSGLDVCSTNVNALLGTYGIQMVTGGGPTP